MAVDGLRMSLFTFQSAVHSSFVLQSLDEQRQKDVLCDVTILVEDRSYRAHCSVLASCTDYFHSRFIGHNRQNLVVVLPDNVTVEGFEPLLQFAYTAKLLFTKDNILEIHRCAQFLGFHNLDQSCFEFLIPKFHKSPDVPSASQKVNKTKRDKDPKGQDLTTATQVQSPKNSFYSHPQTSAQEHLSAAEALKNTSQTTAPDRAGSAGHCQDPGLTDIAPHLSTLTSPTGGPPLEISAPKSLMFREPSGQDQFHLQNCGPQLQTSLSSTPEVCPFLKMVGGPGDMSDFEAANNAALALTDSEVQLDVISTEPSLDVLPAQFPLPNQITLPKPPINDADATANMAVLTPGLCGKLSLLDSPGSFVATDILESTSNAAVAIKFELPSQMTPCNTTPETSGSRSSVEREVAEHLAKGFWPEISTVLSEPVGPGKEVVEHTSASENASSASSTAATDFHWLKHMDLSSTVGECPFLSGLGSEEAHTPAGDCSSLPQQDQDQDRSPCISPVGSEDDLQSDTEAEREGHRERAEQIRLPFPVEQIPAMSRRAFLQMLRKQTLTPEQLEFVHDVRRRSKNRVAAQRSRKRKLDCILSLEYEIKKLQSQKERLLQEQKHLKVSMGETLQGLTGLCQAVAGSAVSIGDDDVTGPNPPQLQSLLSTATAATVNMPTTAAAGSAAQVAITMATVTTDLAPSSVLLTPMASPSLAGQEQESPGADSSVVCASKEPSAGDTATPCGREEPAMPEGNSDGPQEEGMTPKEAPGPRMGRME